MTAGVVRFGDTVRRPTGVWTPAVHRLLGHLEAVGFDGAPRVRGIDEAGREVLTWIPGEVAHRPFAPSPVGGEGLWRMARLLRGYHDAVAGWRPEGALRWCAAARTVQPWEVVCHGDVAPWNVVWQGEEPVALIDWDLAEPGPRIRDVAWLAWYAVPLSRRWQEAGVAACGDLRVRLAVLCDGYGRFDPGQVVRALQVLQRREHRRTARWGVAGREPWASFLGRVPLSAWDDEAAWLAARAPELG
ncbi:aminoglycoside phosphotransferase family protein [Euzebya sp.]|uniref:aminoglycoside phosphotransferase family protein n=1 Tax=Euzebya sp. TaxID=1971409 RepID=UPI0035199427